MSRFRPFVSVLVMFTFLAITASGIVLYFHARTLGNMAVWRNVHIWFSFAFIFGAVIHLAINWKALVHYFPGASRSVQWALATVLCAVLLAIVISAGGSAGDGRQQRGPRAQGQVEAAK